MTEPEDGLASGLLEDKELLAMASELARSAGVLINRERYAAEVMETQRRDIKLNLDKQVESHIIAGLASSGIPILCEESGWIGKPSATYWAVDGLDGTVNLHYGLPFAAVSIALVRDASPILGAIYDFTHDEMFSGAIGLGVSLNGRPVTISRNNAVEQALLLTALATRGKFDPETLGNFGQRLGRWRKVRMLGSAALSLAYVASGRADACEIEGIMIWDVMAGIALVRAAGGYAVCSAGFDSVVDVIATNGKITFEG